LNEGEETFNSLRTKGHWEDGRGAPGGGGGGEPAGRRTQARRRRSRSHIHLPAYCLGNLGCRGLTRGRLFLGTFSCGCPSGATGVPLFTIWDPVAGPPSLETIRPPQAIELYSRYRPPGRGILGQGLRGGVRVGLLFGARRRKGLDPVTFN